MNRITIQEFAVRLAQKKGISTADAQRFLNAMLDVINEGLNADKVVKIKGLGTFKVIDVKERKSVDVNTGEEILIEGRGKITFTPDAIMRDLVNKPFSQFDTVVLNEGVDFSELESDDYEDEEFTENKEDKETAEPQHVEKILEEPLEEVEHKDEKSEIDYVTEESFSEALLVLDYINGKGLPEEHKPVEEEDEGALDATEEAIADALFAINSNKNSDSPTVETTDEVPKEAVPEEKPTTEIVKAVEKPEYVEPLEESNDEEETVSTWKRWLIAGLLIAAVGLLSYYCIDFFNNNENKAKEEVENNNAVVVSDSIENELLQDSIASADSLAMAIREKEIEDSITALTKKDKAEKHVAEPVVKEEPKPVAEPPVQTKPQPPVQTNNKELEYAKRLVQYGAYNIVGTDKVITIKKGQTMTSVAKAYLGKDMACYIEVHNGTTTLIEGQKLKIPKLQIKKKAKR